MTADGYNLPTNTGNRAVLLGAQRTARTRLVEVNSPNPTAAQQWSTGAGSWVLSLRSITTSSGLQNQVNAAQAIISMGAGGASIEFAITIFPDTTIALPSGRCTVDVAWDPLLPADYALPTQLEIFGLIQRSFAAPAPARLLRWLPLVVTTGSGELGFGTIPFPIPAFARTLRVDADPLVHPGVSSDMQWILSGGTLNDTMTGMQLHQMTRHGAEYDLGGAFSLIAGNMNVAVLGGSPLTLTPWALDWGIQL